MKKFHRVAIIGTGLIGGSIGLALRKKRLAREVVGVSRTRRSLRIAKKRGAIDWGTTNPVQAIRNADLVILATPISRIHPIARQIAPHLKPGCLVTDVASTKQAVIRELEQIFPPSIRFVGSHPLAGREKSGVGHAAADLFRNAPCFVVPTRRSTPQSVQTVARFWKVLGAEVILIGAKRHDAIVSKISHLPHVVASLLVLTADKTPHVGTGFIDTTRIASSDTSLWRDILLSNRKEVAKDLRQFGERLKRLQTFIEKGKGTQILRTFQQAKRLRDRFAHR